MEITSTDQIIEVVRSVLEPEMLQHDYKLVIVDGTERRIFFLDSQNGTLEETEPDESDTHPFVVEATRSAILDMLEARVAALAVTSHMKQGNLKFDSPAAALKLAMELHKRYRAVRE